MFPAPGSARLSLYSLNLKIESEAFFTISVELMIIITIKSNYLDLQKCRDQDSNLGYCGHNAGS